MENVTLKLHEIYTLHAELNGLVNNQTGKVISKGLLGEKLKLSTKYWITELTKDENGNISIPRFINIVKNEEEQITSADINPKFVEFEKEFNNLLQEEKTLEHKEFKLADFENIETEGIYTIFFKLVKPE